MDEFLSIEARILMSIEAEKTVISTGGSAVYSSDAMEHLRKIGKVIYIRLDEKQISERLSNITTRGIATTPGETLEDLYRERKPLYEKNADIIIDTTDLTIEQSVEKVVTEVKGRRCSDFET